MEDCMKTLYIDTHSEKVELALFVDEKLLKILQKKSLFQQSSIIMPMLEELLETCGITTHQLDDIIVINGPGSFTGVRLGVTIAKTLAYTLRIPIRVMSSILIQAVSNKEKGHHWFVEKEKNGYFVGEFNDLDELLNDYIYVKNADFELFKKNRNIIEHVILSYESIYLYSRSLPPVNSFTVNPLYVKLIEVQK